MEETRLGNMKRAYSVAEARDYIGGVSQQTIYRLLGNGALKSYKIGTRRFILKSELDEYIDRQLEVGV